MKLICYLSNGYPSVDGCVSLADVYVAAGCDVIEVDLPCRDPYLESPLIAGRMHDALARCDDYDAYLSAVVRIKQAHPEQKVIIVVYESTVLEIGTEKFAACCTKNGLLDLIVVGSEGKGVKQALMERGMRISCYIQYHMPEEEIAEAKASNGFVYMQARPTTGHVNPAYPTLKDCLLHLDKCGLSDRDYYCGVGVHTLADVAMVKAAGGDGAFVGKAILECGSDETRLTDTIRAFRAAAQ